MKSLTVGKKIILGFSTLVVIALLLGLLAVTQMNDVKEESERLSQAYVPEVELGNGVERYSLLTMYANRAYSYTEEEQFYKAGQVEYANVIDYLDKCRVLAEEQNLDKLAEYEPQCRSAAEKYQTLLQGTVAANQALAQNRDIMDVAAGKYMQNCEEFLHDQFLALDKDVRERAKKIELVSHIVEIGTNTRVNNFKAQATNDMSLLEDAITGLNEVYTLTQELRKISSDDEDLARIERTEKAAKTYAEAMSGFHKETTKANPSETVLNRYRAQMDEAAATYVATCDEYLAGQQNKLIADVDERSDKIELAAEIVILGGNTRVANFKSQATRDPELMKHAIAGLGGLGDLTDQLRKITYKDADLKRIDQTEASASNYSKGMQDFLANWLKREELNKQRGQAGDEVIALAQATSKAALSSTKDIANSASSDLGSASIAMQIGLAIALILGVTLALLITRSITKPLNAAIQILTNGAEQTSSASGQVSAASQSLAEGSSEQASSLEETSSSLEEMASMTKRNAENAMSANELASQTRAAADSGAQEMADMTAAMEAIKTSSDDISKIIKTIDEIAFQTNILALNAAVEAARAGEAGMGFAVVADEVRSLAQRSAVAARETAEKIEDAVQKSEQGVSISGRVAESLNQIVAKARQVDSLVGEIANASNEQSQGIQQVNEAVSQMDQVTQSNAANAEETASAAEELNAQSEELKSVVSELVRMVGGNTTSLAHSGSTARNVTHSAHSYNRGNLTSRSNNHKSIPQRDKGAKALTSDNGTSRGKEAATVTDDDFKDF